MVTVEVELKTTIGGEIVRVAHTLEGVHAVPRHGDGFHAADDIGYLTVTCVTWSADLKRAWLVAAGWMTAENVDRLVADGWQRVVR